MLSGSLGVCEINGELILPGEKYLISQFGLGAVEREAVSEHYGRSVQFSAIVLLCSYYL